MLVVDTALWTAGKASMAFMQRQRCFEDAFHLTAPLAALANLGGRWGWGVGETNLQQSDGHHPNGCPLLKDGLRSVFACCCVTSQQGSSREAAPEVQLGQQQTP